MVEIKNVYGVRTIYPVCDTALTFCNMLGQKTLTHMDLTYIKKLGFEVKVKQSELFI